MSKEKIESRRAFMKKLGKTVAGAAAFIAVAKTVEATPSEDNPVTLTCGATCSYSCQHTCSYTCQHTCSRMNANGRGW
ncbi:MAG: twin-arginine translocation signal domain-containing protein [Thermoguttaceae bacterium]|nr:twin-arginine translocation signal domain-containing protein [Thermoguttaceae bacterium]